MSEPLQRLRNRWVDVLLVAVGVMLFGAWDQPVFSDELATSRNVFTFAQGRTLVPGHFAYGPLYSYLAAPFAALGIALQAWSDGQSIVVQAFVDWFATPERLVWWTRVPSLVAYVVLARLLLRRAAGSRTPAVGALLVVGLLLWPPFLRYGAFAVPDVLVSLLAVVALAQWDAERPGRAGFAFGLAFAAKATAATVGFAWIAAPLLLANDLRGRARVAGRLAVGGLIGFVVGAPSWLVAGRAHLEALLAENAHVRVDGHLVDWGIDGVWLIERLVPDGIVFLAAAVAVAVLVRQRRMLREPWVWGAVGALVLLWGIEKKSAHYLLPLLSTVAYGVLQPRRDDGTSLAEPLWLRGVAWMALLAILGIQARDAFATKASDGRAAAGEYLRDLLQPGDTVWLAPDYVPVVVDVDAVPWSQRPHVDARARDVLDDHWRRLPRARVVRTPVPDWDALAEATGRVFLVEASAWSDRFVRSAIPPDHPRSEELALQRQLYLALHAEGNQRVSRVGEYGEGGNVIRIWELRRGPR